MTDEEYRIMQEKRHNSATERQKRKRTGKSETLCWKCRNLRCSWIQNLIPVPNWTAEATVIRQSKGKNSKQIPSYVIYKCPEFKE